MTWLDVGIWMQDGNIPVSSVDNFRKRDGVSMRSSISVSCLMWFVFSLASGANSQTGKPTLDSTHTHRPEIHPIDGGSDIRLVKVNLSLNYYDTKIQCENRYSDDNKEVKLCKYESGAVESETHFIDGKEDGVAVGWYENGARKYEIPYNRGRLKGVEIQYYNTGSKLFEIRFKNDMKDGVELWWYENGAKRSESSYKEGKKEGIEKNWDEQGNLTTKVWKNGVEEK